MNTFLIAEAGSSHDGELAKAMRLIHEAKVAGADAVKFQTFQAETLARRRNAIDCLPVYRRYEMPLDWLPILKAECEVVGIEFMTTCYHVDYLPIIAPYVQRFKVASFEAVDREFLATHFPYGKPLIISTGMMDENEVFSLDTWLHSHAPPLSHGMLESTLLHCVSAYPTPLEAANLRAITCLRWPGDLWSQIGLSDHTAHEWTGALAVAAGASVLEVHLRLPDTDPANPDSPHSLTPEQLRRYVEHVRLAERMLGDGVKAPQPSEQGAMKYRVGGTQRSPCVGNQ